MTQNSIKRIVILGNSGFIGRHLEKYFLNGSPRVEVMGFSLPVVDLTKSEDYRKLIDCFDLGTAVIVCAAMKRQLGDTLELYQKNMRMTENLSAVLEKHPVGRLIYFSSAAVYGEDVHNLNITEETPVCPKSYYGMAKFSSERLLLKVAENSLVILRPTTVYGLGDMANAYGPGGFLRAALEGKEITLWGDGTELRDFVFVDDLISIVGQLTFNDFKGVLNVATGESQSFKDILNMVSQLVPEKINISSRPRSKDKVDNQFNIAKLASVLGNFRFTSVEDGMRKILESELTLKKP